MKNQGNTPKPIGFGGLGEVEMKQKITNKDVVRALKLYDIGKAEKIKEIKKGIINYNFDVKTEKGRFIVRFVGDKLGKEEIAKFKLKFRVLNHLKSKNFPYKIPVPIKNNSGKYLTHLGKKNVWIYERIRGKSISKPNRAQVMALVKALATYDKFVSKVKCSFKPNNYNWLLKNYSRMRKVKGKRPLDRLMLKNIDLFEKLVLEWKKRPFNKRVIPIHSDFHTGNALFDGDKVVAILDFGNVRATSRVRDIAYFVKIFCIDKVNLDRPRMNRVLRNYEKINPLTKEEKAEILRFIVLYNCILFWWFYEKMDQAKHKKYTSLKDVVESTKNLIKKKGWDGR